MSVFVDRLAGAVCTYLLAASTAAAALPVLAWLVIKVGRIRTAVYRHAIWLTCTVGILLVPPLWLYAPKLKLAILPAAKQVAPPIKPLLPEPDLSLSPHTPHPTPETAASPHPSLPQLVAAPASEPFPLRPIVAGVWLVGAAIMLVRLGIGWRRVARICRSATPLTEPESLDGLPLRGVRVLVSGQVPSPVCFGVFRPVIVMPQRLLAESGQSECRMILGHELAHVARRDVLINMLQRLMEAVLFFHPLVWVASRLLTQERERVCDNWVVAHGADASAYAEFLSRLAEQAFGSARLQGVALFEGGLLRRVRDLLDPRRARLTRLTRLAALACTLVALIAFGAFGILRLVHAEPKEQPAAAEPSGSAPEPREEAKEPSKPTSNANEPAWGEAVDDLQAGILIESGKRAYRIGETVSFAYKLRNIGKRTIRLNYVVPNREEPWDLKVFDSQGRYAYFSLPFLGQRSGVLKEVSISPGETITLYRPKITIWPIAPREPPPLGTLCAQSGKYWVSLADRGYGHYVPETSPMPTRWSGGLSAGRVELEVVPASPGEPFSEAELAELPAGTSPQDAGAVLSLLGECIQETLYAGMGYGLAEGYLEYWDKRRRAWEKSCGALSRGEIQFMGYVATRHGDPTARAIACRALGLSGSEDRGPPLLLKALEDASAHVRSQAARGLGHLRSEAGIPALLALLTSDPEAGVRASAGFALGHIGNPKVAEDMKKALAEEKDDHVKYGIRMGLYWIQEKTAEPTPQPSGSTPETPEKPKEQPEAKADEPSWGDSVNGITVSLKSDGPTILYPPKGKVFQVVENKGRLAVSFVKTPPYLSGWTEAGRLEVVDENGQPIEMRQDWRTGETRLLQPGKHFSTYYFLDSYIYGLAFPGPGKYKARLALQCVPADGGKPFTVGSKWHEFDVQLTPHKPGMPMTAHDELVLAQAHDYVLRPQGKITKDELIQKYLNVAKKYPGTRYALHAYHGAAYVSEQPEFVDAKQQKKDWEFRRKCYQTIVDQWPELVTHETIFARKHLANWARGVESQIEFYRWLISRKVFNPSIAASYLRNTESYLASPIRSAAELKRVIEALPGTPAAERAAKELAVRAEADKDAEAEAWLYAERTFAAAAAEARAKASAPEGTSEIYLACGHKGLNLTNLRVGWVYASKEDALLLSNAAEDTRGISHHVRIQLFRRSARWRTRALRLVRTAERERSVRDFVELHPDAKEVRAVGETSPTTQPSGSAPEPAEKPKDQPPTKSKAADPAWGEAVNGVEVRLRALKDPAEWGPGETPEFRAYVYYLEGMKARVARRQERGRINFDGQWYQQRWDRLFRVGDRGGGKPYDYTVFSLRGDWRGEKGARPLRLTAGRHTLRVAFDVVQEGSERTFTVISNPVEIEIFQRVMFLGLDLTDAPRTTKAWDLPDLWEERPAGSKSYELREGVVVGRHPEHFMLGDVLYLSSKNVFYVQHDPIGSSTMTFYGPFDGKPWKRLGIPADQTQTIIAPSEPETLSFGPVIERVLGLRQESAECFFDFDTGNLFSVPSALSEDSSVFQGANPWIARSGIDICGGASKGLAPSSQLHPSLTAFNFGVIRVSGWNVGEPELKRRIRFLNPIDRIAMGKTSPATYLFRTREGGMGMLQIVGFSESPPGVKIRYKMVQQAAAERLNAAHSPVGVTVLDLEGKPVPGAQVGLFPPSPSTFREPRVTDDNGTCRVQLDRRMPWEQGDHVYLVARHLARRLAAVNDLGEVNADAPGAKLPQSKQVTLRPAVSVVGRLVNEQGEPVQGAWVYLRFRGAVSWFSTQPRARSGTDGRFEFPCVVTGEKYRVEASPPGYSREEREVVVARGAEGRLDAGELALRRKGPAISGTVADPLGTPR